MEMTVERRVYIVDDEDAVRRAVGFMLRTSGFKVETVSSGEEFLKNVSGLEPGCVLLDVRMPGIDGLQVMQALNERGIMLPVVIMTGHGDISMAVRAMKGGAVDFIEKPFEKAALLAALEIAFLHIDKSEKLSINAQEAQNRLNILTLREMDVLKGLVSGLPNKSIGFDLGISPRTVEIHRANLMSKLEVKSLSDVLKIAFMAGMAQPMAKGTD
jgi:two-component system, LuxR family, response regulator FixJ